MNKIKADVLIVGTGASGLFAALHIPSDMQVMTLKTATPIWRRVEFAF